MDANSSEFTNYTQLSTQRSFASSVMLQNGSLLVLGGRNEDFALKSTELVSESGVQASIDLSHATFLSLYNGIRLPIVESM